MINQKQVGIGIIGAGFLAETRARCYAPSINKAERLLAQSGGTIVEMRGGECHSGSHSPFSKRWRYTGGGALLRLGAHPIGAMLYPTPHTARLRRVGGWRLGDVPLAPPAQLTGQGHGDIIRVAGSRLNRNLRR